MAVGADEVSARLGDQVNVTARFVKHCYKYRFLISRYLPGYDFQLVSYLDILLNLSQSLASFLPSVFYLYRLATFTGTPPIVTP